MRSGPQDQDGVTREMAVELLRQLLQSSTASPSDPHAVTSEFLLQSLRALSSAEAVGLMPWAEVASAPSHGAFAPRTARAFLNMFGWVSAAHGADLPVVCSRQNRLGMRDSWNGETVQSTKCCNI
jgi:hypothetical protein